MNERLLYIFFIGCVFGWCLETVYRRFCKNNTSRKWINPGFLIGPYLPLYGFGLCTLFLLAEFKKVPLIDNIIVLKLFIALSMAICMTLLEFIAGMIFVNGMKLKLWDYSNKPFNVKGIICLEFSFYWFVLAVLYYAFVHEFIYDFTNKLLENKNFLFPLGFLSGVFAIDLCYTMQIAAKIKKFATENDILVRYEELKANIRKHAEEHKERYMFMFAFYSKKSLNEHLKKYSEIHTKLKKLSEKVKHEKLHLDK